MNAGDIIAEIARLCADIGRPVKLMEVCGTHTVSIFRHGIKGMLPGEVSLISGPGCPVCVTPLRDIDAAIRLSLMEKTVIMTFGDMMHVPGRNRDSLYKARGRGAAVDTVYSPLDALEFAANNRALDVVFFATGFETTSPLIAATLKEAHNRGIRNFSIYSAHKLVPPALRALLNLPAAAIDGFILPGHVSTIIGKRPYEFIAAEFRRPGVITGFEGMEILMGIYMLLLQIAQDRAEIEIEYKKAVRPEGNPRAVSLIEEVFTTVDIEWRGLGVIPMSGLSLNPEFSYYDARGRLPAVVEDYSEITACQCADVLRGIKTPPECALFKKACTPENPVGACMVSSEGSCSAYFKYGAIDNG
ncbi:hydrogenase formation protein HypD [Candidatus Magnetominusculus dajiuhuensis]|uniref:hydrogenase formation protein HypD n=1 Tax=Candidatus Magnetominusculus dajiuhuensis TaxID=3137712 RepID=UPI003B43A85D